MPHYGQYCPIAVATEVLAERWTLLILREIGFRGKRFNEIRRGVPLISQSLLAKRLRDLERNEIIERRPQADGASEYHLTPAGDALKPIILEIGEWSKQWLHKTLDPTRLNPSMLMWEIRHGVDPTQFPIERTVVQVEFTDLGEKTRNWWLVNEANEVDLCYTDPGYDVDLFISTTLMTMTEVWFGELSMSRATNDGHMSIRGRNEIRRRFRSWLKLSIYAGTKRRY